MISSKSFAGQARLVMREALIVGSPELSVMPQRKLPAMLEISLVVDGQEIDHTRPKP